MSTTEAGSPPGELTRPVKVFLLHGTFARNAPWTQIAKSDLIRAVTEALRKEKIDAGFEAIEWSGGNSVKARMSAARDLIARVDRARRSSPDMPLFAIGHSHGGSALAYALRYRSRLSANISAAFLSTPFVDLKIRPFWPRIVEAFLYSLLFLALLLLLWSELLPGALNQSMSLVVSFVETWGSYLWGQYEVYPLSVQALVFAPLLICVGAIFFSIVKAARWCTQLVVKAAGPSLREVPDYFSTATLPVGRYRFVRCGGDEASLSLSAVQAFSTAIGLLCRGYLGFVGLLNPMRLFGWAREARRKLRSVAGPSTSWAFVGIGTFFSPILFVCIVWIAGVSTMYFSSPNPDQLGLLGGYFSIPFNLALASADDAMRELNGWWEGLRSTLAFNAGRLIFIWIESCIAALSFAVALILLLYISATILLTSALTFLLLAFLAFGGRSILVGLFFDVAVEPIPIGEHTILQLDWDDVDHGLRHSASYQHPMAHRMLAAFILGEVQSAACASFSTS